MLGKDRVGGGPHGRSRRRALRLVLAAPEGKVLSVCFGTGPRVPFSLRRGPEDGRKLGEREASGLAETVWPPFGRCDATGLEMAWGPRWPECRTTEFWVLKKSSFALQSRVLFLLGWGATKFVTVIRSYVTPGGMVREARTSPAYPHCRNVKPCSIRLCLFPHLPFPGCRPFRKQPCRSHRGGGETEAERPRRGHPRPGPPIIAEWITA